MHVTFFYVKKKSWNDFTHLLLEFFFQRGVAVRFSDTLLEETGWLWNFFHSGIAQFGDPRVGQLGQEKRRLKFSRTGKRAQGIILLTNQFYDIFECLSVFVPNQRSASIGLLSWSHKKEFTCKLDCSPCTSLARSGLRAFFEQSFQQRRQSLLYQFHSILLYHWGENFNKFTHFKGRKNSPACA